MAIFHFDGDEDEFDTEEQTDYCRREKLEAADREALEKHLLKLKVLGMPLPAINDYGTLLRFPPDWAASVYTVPDFVKALHPYAFARCDALREVTLPTGLKLIPQSCFLHCKNIEKINGLDSVEFVDVMAFDDCPKLETLVFSDCLWGMVEPFALCEGNRSECHTCVCNSAVFPSKLYSHSFRSAVRFLCYSIHQRNIFVYNFVLLC